MPKVTVVVPVYNAEHYLGNCVQSLQAQTEPDWELLLVDDGSTDNSGALCDRLSQQDPRIRAIHQKNQGPGAARNTGVEAAAGEWLMMVDSDDWLEPSILKTALAAGENLDVDIVSFAYRTVDESGKELGVFQESVPKNRAISVKECPEILLTVPCPWGKLYRTSFFRQTGLRYPSPVWYEDFRVTPKLLLQARRVVFLEDVGYSYLQRPGSIMNSANVQRNGDILPAMEDLVSYFQEQGAFQTYHAELEHMAVAHVLLLASMRVLAVDPKHPLLGQFSAYVRKHFPQYRKNKYENRLTRNQRIALALIDRKLYGLVALLSRVRG